jgi:hypothetical protein
MGSSFLLLFLYQIIMNMDPEIVSTAWRLHGALALGGYEQGILKLTGGKISFATDEGEQFNVPLLEVRDVKWPFYQLGLSFTAVINDTKYRFVFASPFGNRNPITVGDEVNNILNTFTNITSGSDAAKKWKAVLGK